MLETPEVVEVTAIQTATIRLTIPRDQIQTVMDPAIREVISAVVSQGAGPAGPVFSHHFKMHPDTFDFEVGVPVTKPVTPVGRVQPSQLRSAQVARTVYCGPYDGLGDAWGEFCGWIAAQGLKPAPDLWEYYVTSPEVTPDPKVWRTELNQPLVD